MTTLDHGRVINGTATNIRDRSTEPPHYRAVRGGPRTSRVIGVFGLALVLVFFAGLMLSLSTH